MIKKLRDCTVYVGERANEAPPQAIHFLTSEWAFVERFAQSLHDPEEKRQFWEGIKEKKLSVPGYCVFEDFPQEENQAQNIALKYCREIREMLMGRKRT